MHIPQPFEFYKHFKGNLYQIIALAEHSESGEALVVYQALYGDFKIYARPLSMFMERTDKIKYPQAVQDYRFELQEKIQTEERNEVPAKKAEEMPQKQDVSQEEQEKGEILSLDPLVVEFLEAVSYEQRLNILTALHHRITDDMINVMAMACDLEIREGEAEQRYLELKSCLLKMDKFECNRIR